MNAPRSIDELDSRVSEPPDWLVEKFGRWQGDICVPGAGGKMGYHLCLMLRRIFDLHGSKNRVLAVSRFSDSKVRNRFEKAGIETFSLDLTIPEQVLALPSAKAVVYMAGKKFGTSEAPDELRRFNEEMPRAVADRYARIPIVAYSTGCVYPFVEPASGGSVESDIPAPTGAYAESCLGRERVFREVAQLQGTPVAIIRLNYAVDLQYGVLVDLAQRVSEGFPVDVTMGYFNCIWQGDAIAHSLASLFEAKPGADPFVLNVTGERILSVREVTATLGRAMGCEWQITGVESETAWLSNATRAHQLFGPTRINEDRLIEWVADWIGKKRPILGKPTHFEVRDGKY